MMKKNKTLWIVSFLPLAISAILFFFLPERIPMHYDVAGNIGRWGSRREIFIFPVIIPLISLFWQCMIRSFEKTAASAKEEKARAEAQSNIRVLRLTAIWKQSTTRRPVCWISLRSSTLSGRSF